MDAFGPFPPDCPDYTVGLAISGGADSLALAWLARGWRRHVVAFVVDHGLRESAADEARQTIRTLASFGVSAHLLTLQDLRRDARLQEAARSARYAALIEACVSFGCLDLMVAHHADDQIETVAMRSAAASGPAGLAGMAASRELSGIRLLRPLLCVRRDRLRATLDAHGIGWIEDPSNDNRRFERVRFRQDLSDADGLKLWTQANAFGGLRDERAASQVRVLVTDVLWHPSGFFIFPQELPPADLLATLWRVISGRAYAPGVDVIQKLFEGPGTVTLHGVLLTRTSPWGWILVREPAAVGKSIRATSDGAWDGRWRLAHAAGTSIEGCTIAAIGTAAAAWARDVPGVVRRSLPALWRDGRLEAIPDICRLRGGNFRRVSFQWSGSHRASEGSFWRHDPFSSGKCGWRL